MQLIKKLQAGEAVTSFSQIQSKQVRFKRDGDPYLRLVLRDSSGCIEARLWNHTEELDQAFKEGDFVKYKAKIELYNGNRQLILERIRKAVPEDRLHGFKESELVARTDRDIEEMWKELQTLIDEHTTKVYIRKLLSNILAKFREEIKTYPAGVEVHHNYWGGFLEHILSVLESAVFFSKKYPTLDQDLLVAGAVLHDIGKIQELGTPHASSYTVRGHLIGHVVLGFDLLQKEASLIPNFPSEVLTQLGHLILSHQGRRKWGSPKRPKTPEALVLHYIDDLDAKMNRFFRVLEQDEGRSDFTAFDYYLQRSVYKGSKRSVKERVLVASS